MLKTFSLFILILSLSACVTPSKLDDVHYTGKNELYPAVIGAFNDIRAKIEEIDVINNKYLSEYIIDDSGVYQFKVAIEYKKGMLSTKLSNIQLKDKHTKKWKTDSYAAYSFKNEKFIQSLSNSILNILKNQNIYDDIKKTIHQNIGFHYMVMKHLGNRDLKNWIRTKMKNTIYSLRLTNEDTVFLTNSSNKTDKKYIAHLNYSSHRNSEIELPFSAEFDLDLHTNNENYKMLKPGAILNTKAKIVDATVHVYITTFGLSLDEQIIN